MQNTLPASLDPPGTDADVSENMSGVRSEIATQVQSLFASFAKSLEGRFTAIDEKFSRVMSSSSSKVPDDRINVSQDVIEHSLAAPSPVAICTEHPPDKAPFVSYTDDLGTTLGGPAAASAPFSDLLTTVRFF